MKVGDKEVKKSPPYFKGKMKMHQVVTKTYVGSVNGKPRWKSKTTHERV